MSNPLVSVIIPTHNSDKTLEDCLKSISNQTYKNIETIIIDAFSGDKTKSIAKKYAVAFLSENVERSRAKNIGIKKSKGKYLCFIDSDMVLSQRVIQECVRAENKDEKVTGVIIPEHSIGDSYWVKVRDFERSFYKGTSIESARFFRADLVKKTKGFDEDLITFEEATLPRKIEKLGSNKYYRIKSEIIHAEYSFSLMKWLKKKYYYGQSAKKYSTRYENNQLNTGYRMNLFLKNKRFYSKPLLGFSVIVLKTMEFISMKLGETFANNN